MKRWLFCVMLLTGCMLASAQNAIPESEVYYNTTDTTLSNDTVFRFPVADIVSNQVWVSFDSAILLSHQMGYSNQDSSGVWYLIAFRCYCDSPRLFAVAARNNSELRSEVHDFNNIYPDSLAMWESNYRVYGCGMYKGFLYVIHVAECIDDSDIETMFEKTGKSFVIKTYGERPYYDDEWKEGIFYWTKYICF